MKLFEQLMDLLLGFTIARARSVITLLVILFFAAWVVDWWVGYSAYNRLERAVTLTERLDALERRGPSSKEISELRSNLISQLQVLTGTEAARLATGISQAIDWYEKPLVRGIAGMIPWILISLLVARRLGWAEYVFVQLYGIPFGLLNAVIPSYGRWWLDLLVVPWSLMAGLVLAGMIAVVVEQAFRSVRRSAQGRAILNNLRQIGVAADQYFLEKGQTRVTYVDLVGRLNYLRPVQSVEGERYDDLVIEQGRPISIKRPSGEVITASA